MVGGAVARSATTTEPGEAFTPARAGQLPAIGSWTEKMAGQSLLGDVIHFQAELSTEMNNSQNDQQSVWQTEQNRLRATLQVNIPVLEQILTNDYFFSNSRGEIITKTEFLTMLQAGVVKYESLDLQEAVIRMYGNTAIVTGRLRETGTFQDQAFDEQFRITQVYIKQAEQGWQSVAYHLTRMVESDE